MRHPCRVRSRDGERASTSRVSRCSAFFNQQTFWRGVLADAGPLAAWMPPSSPQGRVHGVSRKR
ncbi:hypothetical protein XbrCFBP1976_17065 [Xanthomonas bromi]|uniref:Uncharacterized protein n=1 Tax=Xanthomonas bromi TaxID=56449 RepID=A0ABX5BL78_9XANT|nr:hypothetical protein XbrCFBP1976_17065 [Xanthomonas bromi]